SEIQFVMEAVRSGALLAREIEREMVEPALTKDDRSPVTVADFAVQGLIGSLLEKEFATMALVAEEDSTQLRQPAAETMSARVAEYVGRRVPHATPQTVYTWIDRGNAEPCERFWSLDPIDGTKGFLRGDQYAVGMALIEAGQVVLGAIGCPNLSEAHRSDVGGPGTLLLAARGQGAWWQPLENGGDFQPLTVSTIADTAQMRILRSFETGHTNVGRIERMAAAVGVAAEPVRMDSQAKYALLASGHAELLLRLLTKKLPDYRERIWDQAAGALITEEAGGRITDLDGKTLDFSAGRTLDNNRGICASNGRVHDVVLEVLREISTE
ncbi:MAG: 3'(2'),5'-bisphosphate nucleotidase, partial [Candidatus Hydrogenedentes bacterium]|nr:3'(2'),5'-bisphosphate nucleotidase [Candidatus Hydrogenedentota bacterium]